MSESLPKNRREHALVIGGSLAGLMTARVLSDYFTRVTILERDAVHERPESRPGQPQTQHLHGLLTRGFFILEQFFPGLTQTLVDEGAIVDDVGEALRWYQFGGYKLQVHSGLPGLMSSRPFLEWHIRRRVTELPNVEFLDSRAVKELVLNLAQSRVEGVRVISRQKEDKEQTITADLTIDVTGRGSLTPKWLEQLSYKPPIVEKIKVRIGYATRIYKRSREHLKGARVVMISQTPPDGKRMTYLLPIEENRWIVTAGGWAGDYPPKDEQGFLEFIRSLPVPDIYEIIRQAKPLSDIVTFRFPSNLRRHYENLARFPAGYLVLGDAVASFNPVYGQGMSSAAMQAQVLGELTAHRGTEVNWRAYFRAVAKLVELPWQLAVGEDFRYPETEGPKPPAIDLLNGYVARVHRATHKDTLVYQEFLKVMNLMTSPLTLIKPNIIWRVLRSASK